MFDSFEGLAHPVAEMPQIAGDKMRATGGHRAAEHRLVFCRQIQVACGGDQRGDLQPGQPLLQSRQVARAFGGQIAACFLDRVLAGDQQNSPGGQFA